MTPIAASGQNEGTSREPFVLELPGISDARYTQPVVRLSDKEVPLLKVRVLSPFSKETTYGSLVLTVNGEGINRSCKQTSDTQGYVYTCHAKDKNRLGGYTLTSGKNVLELRNVNKSGREFYASYILLLGDKSAPAPDRAVSGGAPERFRGRKFAVIVGVSDYQYNDVGLRSLDYADDDAKAVAEFLRSEQGGRFSNADITLLLDRDASVGALRSALDKVAKSAGPDDLVFIFIAGHGAPDPFSPKNLYFLFHDTKVANMEKTAFPMEELKRYLDTRLSSQRAFVLIDTCHSAGVNQKTRSFVSKRELTQSGDENNISNFYLSKQLYRERGRAIMTSSDVNEVSQESAKWGNHGVFTWAFLEGLKGKADYNNDGVVTTGEIFQYTRSTVQAATNFQQNPIALPGSSTNLALALVKK